MAEFHEDHPVHQDVRHEQRDVRIAWVLGVAVAAVLLGSLHFVLTRVYFDAQNRRLSSDRASPFPLAPGPSKALPAEPRLGPLEPGSGSKGETFAEREAAKTRTLTSYGPTGDKGYVHVPIDRAMKLVVDKLPKRDGGRPLTFRESGLTDAGEPNSGRVFRQQREEQP